MYEIIVTGSTGFIGKRLIGSLVKKYSSSKILCLVWDNNSEFEQYGRKVSENLGVSIKRIDLRTNRGLADLPKNPKIIIHLAASAETSSSDHRANFPGTKYLINAFSNIGSDTRVIYLSTTAIYSGRKDCSILISEDTKPEPSNEYGRSKLNAENWLKEKAASGNFSLTILRLSTVFGPNPRKNGMFDQLRNSIKKPSVLGIWNRLNWPGLTSLVYVGDVCDIIMQYLKQPPKPGNTQTHILATHSLTLSQISEMAHKHFDKRYKEIFLNYKFWKLAKILRNFVPNLEKLLPSSLYNFFWRVSIIIDNPLNSKPSGFLGKNIKWKPTQLKDKLPEVFGD
jgi:nucleoside-diphosphate-sugar epimerase